MGPFMLMNGTYTKTVAKFEDKILFGTKQEILEIENSEDFFKMPFSL